MKPLKNPMELFKLLDKSNCRACNEPTCLAFAAAVFQGRRPLSDCPHLPEEVLAAFEPASDTVPAVERDMTARAEALKEKIAGLDLAEASERAGGTFEDGRLKLRILGKELAVDPAGDITSDIHINPWVTIPVFSYLLEGKGRPLSGRWVPFRELPGGKTRQGLFGQRCEKALKTLADTHADLFEQIVQVFNGRQVERHYASDISLVLSPLPRVPILICYWLPEGEMASSLNLFFDDTAEENIGIDALYALTAGLVQMFEKIVRRHSFEY